MHFLRWRRWISAVCGGALLGLLLLSVAKGALPVPFISQMEWRWNCSGQWTYNGGNNCGPASVAMTVDAYGKRPGGFSNIGFVHEVRYRMTGVPDNGGCQGWTSFGDMERGLDYYGLPHQRVWSVAEIFDNVNGGKPVIGYVDAYYLQPRLWPQSWAPNPGSVYHLLVVTGKSQDGQWVNVNDPLAYPTEAPGSYTYASFSQAEEMAPVGPYGLRVGNGLVSECPQSGGVILYWNNNYNCDNSEGDAGYRKETGTGAWNISGAFNDKASSIKVPSGRCVILHRDPNLEGSSAFRTGDDNDFAGNTFLDGGQLNDRVSSFEVVDNTYCSKNPVTLYPHQDYAGLWNGGPGEGCWAVSDSFDNAASSVRIWPGWSVRVHKDPNCQGASRCFTSNDSDFANNTFEDGTPLNDQVSSYRVFHNTNCCTPPTSPILSDPSNGLVTCDTTPYFDWICFGCGADTSRIQIDNNSNFSSPERDVTTADTDYTPGSPLALGTYHWRVKSINSCGESSWTSSWTVTIAGTPPAPTLRTPAHGSHTCDTTPYFDWDTIVGATYRIQIDNNSSFTSPERDSDEYFSQYTPMSALAPGTYYWRVRASTSCGTSSWSSAWSFTIDSAPSSAPALYTPANGSGTCDATPYFDWSSVSGATSYRVEVDNSAGFSTPELVTSTGASNLTPSSPLPFGTYYWRVRASNSCGDGPWSSAWSLTVLSPPSAPSGPSPSDDSTGVAINADLDWANAAHATSYDVYFGTSPSPPYYDYTTSSSYGLPTLTYGTHYYWKIVPENACGQNTSGPVWDFTTQCLAPGTPSGPSPSDNASGVSVNADLDWANAPNATSYDVYFGTTSSPPYHGNTSSSSYSLPTLDYDEQYYWRIVARNDCGQTTSGPVWDFTTQCLAPGTPGSPSPPVGATGISVIADLDWADVSNATSYDLYFGTAPNPPYYGNASSSSYTLPTLSYHTHYYWKIEARNACGSTAGPVWDFTTQCLAPGSPSSPSPSDGATEVSINADLDWADAANATVYDVYFGTSSNPPYLGSTSSSSYTLPTLSFGAPYYWKVVARNACAEGAESPVWSFTTSEARLIFVPLAMRDFARGSQPPTPTPTPCPAPPIEDLSFDPASPVSVGTTVNVHAKATWNTCFRAMRLRIDGQTVYELGAAEFIWQWNTLGYAPGDHVVSLEVAGQGDDSWANPSVRENTYHLMSSSQPGIYGWVTQGGSAAVGVPIDLRFYNGDAVSTLSTTSTDDSGAYRFTEPPSLGPGESYYIRFLNAAGTAGRLRIWVTSEITSYTAGTDVRVEDFDIADVTLVSPTDGQVVSLPHTFYWTPRPATPSDDYEFDLIDPLDYNPWWWTEPTLGYVGSYTLNVLPSGFSPGTEYAWEVWVWGPHGWGVSQEYGRSVTLTNTGSGGALAVPAAPRLLPEDLEDWMLR